MDKDSVKYFSIFCNIVQEIKDRCLFYTYGRLGCGAV
jgi:hypothetical protein